MNTIKIKNLIFIKEKNPVKIAKLETIIKNKIEIYNNFNIFIILY